MADKRSRFHLQLTEHHIFVSCWKTSAIYQYNRQGKFVKTLDKGTQSAALHVPTVCATDHNNDVLVSDKRLGLIILNECGHWKPFTRTTIGDINCVSFIGDQTLCAVVKAPDGRGKATEVTSSLRIYDISDVVDTSDPDSNSD